MNEAKRQVVDALAARLLSAHAEFDTRLHESRRRFPENEFSRLWRTFQEYCAGMKGLDWLHRDVAREISGLREYLELEEFRTPGKILAMADRMECILFSDYDPYFDGDEPPAVENADWGIDDAFGAYEGKCAACDDIGRVDGLGLCRHCGEKLERDLLRQRDWAHSATAFGMTEQQCELARSQVVKQFGEDLELIAPSKEQGSVRKRRKRKKAKSKG